MKIFLNIYMLSPHSIGYSFDFATFSLILFDIFVLVTVLKGSQTKALYLDQCMEIFSFFLLYFHNFTHYV